MNRLGRPEETCIILHGNVSARWHHGQHAASKRDGVHPTRIDATIGRGTWRAASKPKPTWLGLLTAYRREAVETTGLGPRTPQHADGHRLDSTQGRTVRKALFRTNPTRGTPSHRRN